MKLSYQEESKLKTLSEVCGRDEKHFAEYMLAKSALNKMADCAFFNSKPVELTRAEILALFSQKVIDLDAQRGMME